MTIASGFSNPVLDSQRVFRAILDAMAHPGRVVALPGPQAPAPLGAGAAAVCLALLDYETPLWLDPAAASAEAVAWLRFHCGSPVVGDCRLARFALIADPSGMPRLEAFDAGTDERPDHSATVVLQVEGLADVGGRRLTGPGIAGESRLDVVGAPAGFWDGVRANATRFPRGVDLILCAGDWAAALPRTTRIEG